MIAVGLFDKELASWVPGGAPRGEQLARKEDQGSLGACSPPKRAPRGEQAAHDVKTDKASVATKAAWVPGAPPGEQAAKNLIPQRMLFGLHCPEWDDDRKSNKCLRSDKPIPAGRKIAKEPAVP